MLFFFLALVYCFIGCVAVTVTTDTLDTVTVTVTVTERNSFTEGWRSLLTLGGLYCGFWSRYRLKDFTRLSPRGRHLLITREEYHSGREARLRYDELLETRQTVNVKHLHRQVAVWQEEQELNRLLKVREVIITLSAEQAERLVSGEFAPRNWSPKRPTPARVVGAGKLRTLTPRREPSDITSFLEKGGEIQHLN